MKRYTDEVWKYTVDKARWEMQMPLKKTRSGHRTVVINGDVHHVGGKALGGFSLERWSFQLNQLKYVETVTLNGINKHDKRLIPLSRYLKRFLNSSTIGLPESFGETSIEFISKNYWEKDLRNHTDPGV